MRKITSDKKYLSAYLLSIKHQKSNWIDWLWLSPCAHLSSDIVFSSGPSVHSREEQQLAQEMLRCSLSGQRQPPEVLLHQGVWNQGELLSMFHHSINTVYICHCLIMMTAESVRFPPTYTCMGFLQISFSYLLSCYFSFSSGREDDVWTGAVH